MFSFIKKKLQEATEKLSRDIQEEAVFDEAISEDTDTVVTQETKKSVASTPKGESSDTTTAKVPKGSKEKNEPRKESLRDETLKVPSHHAPKRNHDQGTTEKTALPAKDATQGLQEHDTHFAKHTSENLPERTTENLAENLNTTDDAEPPETKKEGFFGRVFKRNKDKQDDEHATTQEDEEPKSNTQEPTLQVLETDAQEKHSLLKRATHVFTKFTLSEEKFDELFWDLEIGLLENNVAVEVIEKIKTDLKENLTSGKVARKGIEELITSSLKQSIEEVLDIKPIDLWDALEQKKPYVITFIGVNGAGKTTALAKLVRLLQKHDKTVVVAASDTFRAAAIHQLEEHTNKLGVKLIKHDYQSDPAAVAFDAINHAKAKNIDVVLIDTAGRLHNDQNLMDELKKLLRVNKPDLKLFVGESTTGNDCVLQARHFDNAVGVDAIILTKVDVDEKGGAALSVSYVTKKPILYIGTGQSYEDLQSFSKENILDQLGLKE